MVYKNIYLYQRKLLIGIKAKIKKKGQDTVTASYKIFFLIKN